MWAFVILVSMMAATGAALLARDVRDEPLARAEGEELALNMATYRSFVLSYLRTVPPLTGTVPDSALALPTWFGRYPAWTNQVLGDGTVIVYATRPVPPSLTAELAALSHDSIQAGEARRRVDGTAYLHTPRHGDTGIALPALFPGTPVWVSRLD